jgi:cation:H+ antiporter
LLILGATALIAPIAVARGVLWRDGGFGIAAVLGFILVGWTIGLDRVAGVVFLLAMAGYIYFAYRQEQLGGPHGAAYDRAMAVEEFDRALVPPEKPEGSLVAAIGLFAAGIALVVGGGTLLVDAAISIAAGLGVADEVIGLTIVAIGTSLPELVTSAVAAFRKEGDIALGNVLGSNLYNVLFIGGVTGAVAPSEVPASILGFDLWLLLFISIVAMLFAWTGGRLSRREGLVLVVGYGAYIAFTAGIA